MIYKDFKGLKLPTLGMGCMRLPGGGYGNADIDIEETRKMVDYALKKGVNYFDTAWGYHAGHSETVMGDILKDYPRDSFFLASKFPGYDLSLIDKVEEIFTQQLERCKVDYFDFYLFHNVCELNIDAYLDEKFGIFNYLIEQKKNGKIRHLGFSAHGNLDTMKRFLDTYGNDMEFAQIQLNWLDWNFQNAKAKIELLNSYNIPVWVMEPLRGGKIIKLNQENINTLSSLRPDANAVEWAFRFIQSIPEVTLTLSGMSTFEQLKENIEIFNTSAELSPDETEVLLNIAKEMTSQHTLPCTSCKYCVTHCPLQLDIPWIIELYNDKCYTGGNVVNTISFNAIPDDKKPSVCIACRSCEAVCPQNIKISEMMADFSQKML